MTPELVELFLRYAATGAIVTLLLIMFVVVAILLWGLLKR